MSGVRIVLCTKRRAPDISTVTLIIHLSDNSCEYTHCNGLLAIVPPQGCESTLIEILHAKRYCILVKSPSGTLQEYFLPSFRPVTTIPESQS